MPYLIPGEEIVFTRDADPVAKLCRVRRVALGWRQEDMAARWGVRQETVSAWERGARPIPSEVTRWAGIFLEGWEWGRRS